MPSLALCFSPTMLWLKEIASIGIPSVCILDTDAYHTLNNIKFLLDNEVRKIKERSFLFL
jgi:hypothetical protein